MPRFLTVDRRGSLHEDDVIELIRYDDVRSSDVPDLQEHVDNLFPEGFTSHGEFHFLRGDRQAGDTDSAIELLFEYVRRSHFPDRLSRFQAFFGTTSLRAAHIFRETFGQQSDSIWEVEAEDVFEADMSLLTQAGSPLAMSYRAHLYWDGRTVSNDPLWEVLARPPVRAIRQVEP